MKEQFVTYEIALAMNELGFKEECLAHFNNPPYPDLMLNCENVLEGDFVLWDSGDSLKAPLWQQCIDWFYSEKSIIIEVHSSYEFTDRSVITYHIIINNKYGLRFISKQEFNYNSLYEAREQVVLKAIELCRN